MCGETRVDVLELYYGGGEVYRKGNGIWSESSGARARRGGNSEIKLLGGEVEGREDATR